jgi:hypothetical protein
LRSFSIHRRHKVRRNRRAHDKPVQPCPKDNALPTARPLRYRHGNHDLLSCEDHNTQEQTMKLSGNIAKLGAAVAIVMSLAATAVPASAADYHGMNGRPAVTRHDDRGGPPRIEMRKELAWRDMHFRGRHHEHCNHDHMRFEHASFRR